jgi:hypothetical protein
MANDTTRASTNTPMIRSSRQELDPSHQSNCRSTHATNRPAVSSTRTGQPPTTPISPHDRAIAASPVRQIQISGAV